MSDPRGSVVIRYSNINVLRDAGYVSNSKSAIFISTPVYPTRGIESV